jgi:hypothetical protein
MLKWDRTGNYIRKENSEGGEILKEKFYYICLLETKE